jgi:hypothetical protein
MARTQVPCVVAIADHFHCCEYPTHTSLDGFDSEEPRCKLVPRKRKGSVFLHPNDCPTNDCRRENARFINSRRRSAKLAALVFSAAVSRLRIHFTIRVFGLFWFVRCKTLGWLMLTCFLWFCKLFLHHSTSSTLNLMNLIVILRK